MAGVREREVSGREERGVEGVRSRLEGREEGLGKRNCEEREESVVDQYA